MNHLRLQNMTTIGWAGSESWMARMLFISVPLMVAMLVAACGGGGGGGSTPTPTQITTQPVSVDVVPGATPSFAVVARGDDLKYQWQNSANGGNTWSDLSGATAAVLNLPAVSAMMTGQQYRVTVTGAAGSVLSVAATLTVTSLAPPAIAVEPADQAVMAGNSTSFSVTVTGTAPTYRWQTSNDGNVWSDVPSGTAATLPVATVVGGATERFFRVVVSNLAGSATSRAAKLTVTASSGVPAITTQPVAVSVVAPNSATFSAVATGSPAPTLQWQVSSDGGATYANITGATATSYTLAPTSTADSGRVFRVLASNPAGQVFSTGAVLSVASAGVAPTIALQPLSQSVTVPATAIFTAAVNGSPTPTLQWQISSDAGATFTNIIGATTSSYTTPATVAADNNKQFRVVASNTAGNATSLAATLTVQSGTLTGVRLSLGQAHTCAIRSDRGVACWGSNAAGQLGDGTTAQRLTPTQVFGLTNATSVSAGRSFACALRSDGTVMCWGANALGALGDGTLINRSQPTSVVGITGALAIATGSAHSCALRQDRTVACWGYNGFGQLGDGTTTDRLAPVHVAGLVNVVAISARGAVTCALKQDGTAACWGFNSNGQLGDGSTANRFSPVAVAGLTAAIAIAVGEGSVCSLKVDRTVVCWGSNALGSLGDGTFSDRLSPTAVVGLTDVEALSTISHSCALNRAGTVSCWGANLFGALGNGTTTNNVSPAPTIGLSTATAIAVGDAHSCALKLDGSATCWGANQGGQLGDGGTVNRTTPVAVSGGNIFLN